MWVAVIYEKCDSKQKKNFNLDYLVLYVILLRISLLTIINPIINLSDIIITAASSNGNAERK